MFVYAKVRKVLELTEDVSLTSVGLGRNTQYISKYTDSVLALFGNLLLLVM